jgi:CelD/BcsL family acetyltransferase involved in cellulose biosynthesis
VTVNIGLFDDLGTLAADAAGALDRDAQPLLYRRLDWYRLLAGHCPPDGRLIVARAQSGPTRAWLFLARNGARAASYASWYSLRAGISHVQPDQSETPECVEAIARALRGTGLARVEIGPDESGFTEAAADFRRAGWIVSLIADKANWIARTGDMDFDTYWAARPAKLRNTFKRKAKAAGLDVKVHDRFDAAAWADYESVYRASWKPEEGSFPFLRALAEQEGAAGTLRLGIAIQDGRPVAAQLWLVEDGIATIHKLAYAEDAKSLSPGTILGEAMFRRAIDGDRVRLIDYGVGDEPYKADWMDERRQLWRMIAHNPRILRGLAGAARDAASTLARRLRRR